jgi:hypothetical protein
MPLPAGTSYGGIHVPINRCLQDNKVITPKVLPVKVAACGVYAALV